MAGRPDLFASLLLKKDIPKTPLKICTFFRPVMKTNFYPFFPALGWLILTFGSLPLFADPVPNLVFTEAEWASPNIVRVPFTLTGTLITVRARVDNLEGNFFFDTGASGLLLNSRYFGNQGGSFADKGGSVTGNVRILGSVTVDSLQLDNLQVTEIKAAVVDLSHIENSKKIALVGLIGYAVFKDYQILFDYDASMLLLVRTDSKGNLLEEIPPSEYKPLGSFPVNIAGYVAVVRLGFGSKTNKYFALDSGAEQNLLSNASGKRFLKANFVIGKRVKLGGVGKTSIEVLTGILQNARLDSFQLKPMSTILTNLSEINGVYQTEVDGILGYEFLAQQPVSINFKKRRLTIYRSMGP